MPMSYPCTSYVQADVYKATLVACLCAISAHDGYGVHLVEGAVVELGHHALLPHVDEILSVRRNRGDVYHLSREAHVEWERDGQSIAPERGRWSKPPPKEASYHQCDCDPEGGQYPPCC